MNDEFYKIKENELLLHLVYHRKGQILTEVKLPEKRGKILTIVNKSKFSEKDETTQNPIFMQ